MYFNRPIRREYSVCFLARRVPITLLADAHESMVMISMAVQIMRDRAVWSRWDAGLGGRWRSIKVCLGSWHVVLGRYERSKLIAATFGR